MSNRELKYSSGHRILKEQIRVQDTGPAVDVDAFKCAAEEHFSSELVTAEIFQDDDFLGQLVDRATAEGLQRQDIGQIMAAVRRQISVQANFEARNKIARYKAGAVGLLNTIGRGFLVGVAEAGEHLGFGIATDVSHQQKTMVDTTENMKNVLTSAVEVQVMKHRLTEYTHFGNTLGGTEFEQVIQQYQQGQLKYNELLEHPNYLTGLRAIVDQIQIGDDFVLEAGEAAIDTRDPNVKEAIRRHLIFVLRTEVVQLAEMQKLEVLSSDDYSAEARTWVEKVKKLGRVVLGSGTTWGAFTRMGSKIVIGGSVALLAPGTVGILTGTAIGVGISMAAGMAAAAVREQYFEKKLRRKRQRLEAALGAVDTNIVKNATYLQDRLHQQASEVQSLSETVELDPTNSRLSNRLYVATLNLYDTVADVQVRLLRSRIGENSTALADDPAAATNTSNAPIRRNTRQYLRPQPNSVQENQGPRQDYISFGIANRLEAQKQLLAVFGSALMTVEEAVEKQNTHTAALRQAMEDAYEQAETNLNESQKQLNDKFSEQDKKYLLRASLVGAVGGGVAALAMDAVGYMFSAETVPATLLPGQPDGSITNPDLDLEATVYGDGVVKITKQGLELAQTHLPQGVDPYKVHLEFWGDDITIIDANNGEQLGLIDMTTAEVIKGETVLHALQLPPNLTTNELYRFVYNDRRLYLKVDSSGAIRLFEPFARDHIGLDQTFNVIDRTTNDALGNIGRPLQFSVEQVKEQLLVRSALDGQMVATIQLDSVLGNTAPAPIPATGLLDKIMSNPTLKSLLDTMGLQSSEVKFDNMANSFNIPPDVLKAAGGKMEYLGETTGWRATRMEFILKAASEHKLNESPDMILARAERATRHLLMESAKYHNPQAAFDEAFNQQDASFIQKHDLPWVNGVKADVRDDWMKVVTTMQSPEVAGGGVPAVVNGETLVQSWLEIHPLTLERLLVPVGSPYAVAEYLPPDTVEAKLGGVLARGRDFLDDSHVLSSTAASFFGITAETMTEILAAKSQAPEIASRYLGPNAGENNLHGEDGYEEYYNKTSFLNNPMPDSSRGSVDTAADKIKHEQLESTRDQRTLAAKEELNEFIRVSETETVATFTALKALHEQIVTDIRPADLQQLNTLQGGLQLLKNRVIAGQQLLQRNEQGLDFAAIDESVNGRRLTQWVQEREQMLQLDTLVLSALQVKVRGVSMEFGTVRTSFESGQQTPTQTADALQDLAKGMTAMTKAEELKLNLFYNNSDFDILLSRSEKLAQAIMAAMAVTSLHKLLVNGAVKTAVMDRLVKEDCLENVHSLLPAYSDKNKFILTLEKNMSALPLGEAGLRQVGFLNADPAEIRQVGSVQLLRINEALDKLFTGANSIFDSTPIVASTPSATSTASPSVAVTPVPDTHSSVGPQSHSSEVNDSTVAASAPDLDEASDEGLPV